MWLLYGFKNKNGEGGLSTSQMVNPIKAKEFSSFLSDKETSIILEFAKSTDLWGQLSNDFWSGRVIQASSINQTNKELGKTLQQIKDRALKYIKEHYKIDDQIYSDIFVLTRWLPGMSQSPHSDDMENTPDALNFIHRKYGLIVYLNNDFDGGQTFYPQHNVYINPEPGKMVVHPADTDHMHGVTPIGEGVRFTLASFITFDPTKKMQEY
jgi:hypothetical protein